MTEGEVIEQLVQFTNILLVGISLIFSIISAYVVALNYFIGSSNVLAKFGSFGFVSLVLAMMVVVMMGAQTTQMGLVARLHELGEAGELSAVGRAVLGNSAPEWAGALTGHRYSIDEIVRLMVWAGLGIVYLALAYLTFLHRWTPDAIAVTLQQGRTS